MTVKNLFENEELLNDIVEDIDEIPEDTEVFYTVWALGHNNNGDPTDSEYVIGEFDTPDEAIKCAKAFTFEDFEAEFGKPLKNDAYLSIEVETVVADPDDEDGGTMNIGTIYYRDLDIG